MSKINYFITKFIAAAFFLYGGWLIFTSIYTINAILRLGQINGIYKSILSLSELVGLVGLISLISGLSLLFNRKWGFYLTIVTVLSLWALSLIRVGGLASDWLTLLIASIFLIYLIIARKSIFEPLNRF